MHLISKDEIPPRGSYGYYGSSHPGLIYGELIMTKPPAAANQMVHNKLVNRKPMICAVCDHYISPFTGLPVILEDKDQIIEFAHPACCAYED
jgi:hypothetical protein